MGKMFPTRFWAFCPSQLCANFFFFQHLPSGNATFHELAVFPVGINILLKKITKIFHFWPSRVEIAHFTSRTNPSSTWDLKGGGAIVTKWWLNLVPPCLVLALRGGRVSFPWGPHAFSSKSGIPAGEVSTTSFFVFNTSPVGMPLFHELAVFPWWESIFYSKKSSIKILHFWPCRVEITHFTSHTNPFSTWNLKKG